MTTARFTVVSAGPHVTVQDAGRQGMLRFGVPLSGPMDRLSFAAARASLGPRAGLAAVEVSRGGLVLDCTEGAVSLAIAGGGFRVGIGDQATGSWTVAGVQAGMRLCVLPGQWGSWATLAFAGQMQVRNWLGSASTHGPSGLGGGALRAGDEIVIDNATLDVDRHGPIPCPVLARPRHRVRVVQGPQDRFFDPEITNAFLSQPFALTDAYDRMGVRLSGPPLVPAARLDMPSEPILRGAVQVAGDGVATVLLADHQTTGGYPKIASVLDCDLDGFVQLQSRERVLFQAVTPKEAIAAHRLRHNAVQRYLATLAR